MEVDVYRLKEAIFEVIEIEQDIGPIHLCLWITIREVESSRTTYLQIRQLNDGSAE